MNRIRYGFFIVALFVTSTHAATENQNDRVQMRGDLTIGEGESVQDAVAVLGALRVDGHVRGNAISVFGDVAVGPKGRVEHDAVSVGGRVVRFAGATIGGKEVSMAMPIKGLEKVFIALASVAAGFFALFAGVIFVAYTVGTVALVLLVLTVFDRQALAAQKALVERPAWSFFLGLVGFCSALPMLLLLTITIIGIPLAFIGAIVLGAAVILGSVAVGLWVGTEVAKRFNWSLNLVWSGLLGITLLFLVRLVPGVGAIIHVCIHIFGLGAVMQSRFRGVPTLSK